MEFIFPDYHSKKNTHTNRWIQFTNPIHTIQIYNNTNHKEINKQIQFFFTLLEKYQNLYFAGFFSYELGLYFLNIHTQSSKKKTISLPLIYGGFFDSFRYIDSSYFNPIPSSYIGNFFLLQNYSIYKSHIQKIRKNIFHGNVYQINYTFPIQIKLYGNIYNLFYYLWKWQQSSNSALIIDDSFYILSLSPELFLLPIKQIKSS